MFRPKLSILGKSSSLISRGAFSQCIYDSTKAHFGFSKSFLRQTRGYPGPNKVLSGNLREFSKVNIKNPIEEPNQERFHEPSILGGSLSFALIGSTLAFVVAATIIQTKIYYKTRKSTENVKEWMSSKFESLFEKEVTFERIYTPEKTALSQFSDEIKSRLDFIKTRWDELPRHEKVVWGIIGINTLVFLAWRVPRFQPFMEKHFLHYSNSDRYYTMITSVFSHKEIWHLGFNMFALQGFGANVGTFVSAEHLVAFYLTTGIVSSLVRRVGFSIFPRLSSLNPLIPSLGASGAIYGLVSFIAYQRPDVQAGIVFIPGVRFDLSQMLGCLMALDLLGIIRGWRSFDHFAHLGGALFGLVYSKWGGEYIWLPINKTVLRIRFEMSKYL